MASQNPLQMRITRAVDQARMRQLRRTALAAGIVLCGTTLLLGLVMFSVPSYLGASMRTVFVWMITTSLTLAMPLIMVVALMAAGLTHHEIAGEGGELLAITPLTGEDIADGFVEGIQRRLVWAFDLGKALAAVIGVAVTFWVMNRVFIGDPAYFQAASPPLSESPVGLLVYMLLIVGLFAAMTAWAGIHGLIALAVRFGVIAAFRMAGQDASSARLTAGLATGAVLFVLPAIIALPMWLTFFAERRAGGLVALVALGAGIALLVAAPGQINAATKRALLHSIDRRRTHR